MRKEMNELDIQFLEQVFQNRTPLFFTSVSSKSFYRCTIPQFQALESHSDNYILLSSLKKGSVDKKHRCIKNNKSNISSIQGFTIDIDVRDSEVQIDQLILAIQYFIDESNVPMQPYAYVNSGRGIHLHYLFENTIFLNHAKARKVIETAYKELKNQLNEKVLSHLDLTCDPQINPISQKIRCPGTFNYKARKFAHVKIITNQYFHCGNFLTTINGEYQKFKKKRKVKKSKKNYGITLPTLYKKRIDSIQEAMIFASTVQKDGFRNNGYVTLAWQSLQYQSKEDTEKLLYETDTQLAVPYFKSQNAISSFVKSLEQSMLKAQNRYLKNRSIFDYCTALQIAKDYQYELSIDFTSKTQKELKLEKSQVLKDKKQNLINFLKNYIQDKKAYLIQFSQVAKQFNVSRQTVYNYLYQLLNIKSLYELILFLNLKCFNKKQGFHQEPVGKNKLLKSQWDDLIIDLHLML